MRQRLQTKVLSVALAATMILAPSMTAMASSAGSTGTTSTPATVAPVVTTAENTANSTVAGVGTSTVSGTYAAKSVSGAAVKANAATVSANLGLGNNEKAYVTTWDVTPKTAPKAIASLQIGADSVGATMGPVVQVNVNKMSGGKLTSLEGQGGTVPMSFGIPANFRGDATFAMVKVVSGGQYTILQDQDTNPNTLTVNVSAGNAAYAMIKFVG